MLYPQILLRQSCQVLILLPTWWGKVGMGGIMAPLTPAYILPHRGEMWVKISPEGEGMRTDTPPMPYRSYAGNALAIETG
jgi:hypothetical protein